MQQADSLEMRYSNDAVIHFQPQVRHASACALTPGRGRRLLRRRPQVRRWFSICLREWACFYLAVTPLTMVVAIA